MTLIGIINMNTNNMIGSSQHRRGIEFSHLILYKNGWPKSLVFLTLIETCSMEAGPTANRVQADHSLTFQEFQFKNVIVLFGTYDNKTLGMRNIAFYVFYGIFNIIYLIIRAGNLAL